MSKGYDVCRDSFHYCLMAIPPRLFKFDSVDLLQNIDAGRRLANLKNGVWIVPEIGGR
jgi:hypothetical protein